MYVDRGKLAQIEHDKRLKAYIRENMKSLIQRQKLVKNGKVSTNFSILELPVLKYGRPDREQLASGGGGKQGGQQQGQGQKGGGKGQGGDYEVIQDLSGTPGSDDHSDPEFLELDFEDFVRLAQEQLLEDLDLPSFTPPRSNGEMPTMESFELDEEDRQGIMADLNLERTMFESLQRNIRERGVAEYDVDVRQDGWYFSEVPHTEKSNQALEVYLLDISGSVSGHNIALIRQFIFILWFFLERKYSTNARKFIVFQDEAETVDKEQFFSIESKGGTHISSGLRSALEVMKGFDQYDKFLFFFSDGDNSSSDDDAARELFEKVLHEFDMVCYGRINPCDSPISPFNKMVKEKLADIKKLTFSDIKDLENVQDTIKSFLMRLEA